MKIILLKNLEKFGIEGDIIEVKNGFAKNYLFPKSTAVLANKENINNFINLKKKINEIQKIKDNLLNLNNTTIILPVKIKSNHEIYGVINNFKLKSIIKKLNLNLNIKNLNTNIFFKTIGNYKIEFKNVKSNTLLTIYIMLIKINEYQ